MSKWHVREYALQEMAIFHLHMFFSYLLGNLITIFNANCKIRIDRETTLDLIRVCKLCNGVLNTKYPGNILFPCLHDPSLIT